MRRRIAGRSAAAAISSRCVASDLTRLARDGGAGADAALCCRARVEWFGLYGCGVILLIWASGWYEIRPGQNVPLWILFREMGVLFGFRS